MLKYQIDVWSGELHQNLKEEDTLITTDWDEASNYIKEQVNEGNLVNCLVISPPVIN